MSNEKYRKYIVDMLDHIEDNKVLERIYTFVHRFFIKRKVQKGECSMNEERELKLYDIMDKYNVDMDTAELLLIDEEEEDEHKD